MVINLDWFTFQEWAKSNSSRQSIEDGMLYAYYGKQLLSYQWTSFIWSSATFLLSKPWWNKVWCTTVIMILMTTSMNDNTYILEMPTIFAISALYSCVVVFVFLILPFCYFFYEEGDDDVTTKSVSNYVWRNIFKIRQCRLKKNLFLCLKRMGNWLFLGLKSFCIISENMQRPEIHSCVCVHCLRAVSGWVRLSWKYNSQNHQAVHYIPV